MDIKKELEKRGISISEAADMFGIPVDVLKRYLDGTSGIPKIIRFGIEYALGFQTSCGVNHDYPGRILTLFSGICAITKTEGAQCAGCGAEVYLHHIKTIRGDIDNRTHPNCKCWLDDYKYCGACWRIEQRKFKDI